MRGPKSDAELEAFASQHKDELSRTLSELHTQDHESFRLQSELWDLVYSVLKPPEGKERPTGPALDNIRMRTLGHVENLQRLHEHMVQLSRHSYQIIESQIQQVDSAKAEEEAFMQDIQDKIIVLMPEGMTFEAVLQAEAEAALNGSRKGGSAASRAGRRSKAKAMGSAALAAPAIVGTGELLAPPAVALPIPAHFVEYTFHFPGRPPFTEWIDPEEPVMCSCQQPSQGQMIGCEGPNCKYDWYHYPCVGITTEPEHWICPDCRAKGVS